MKPIITFRMSTLGFFLLLTLSPCVHLSFGFPSSPFPKLDDASTHKQILPSQESQQIVPSLPPLPMSMPVAITSSIKTTNSQQNSRNGIQFPSQSKSLPHTTLPQNKFIYAKTKNDTEKFLHNGESTITPASDTVHHQLSPSTNGKRQIGNRVSWNLHKKATVQVQEGGEVEMNLKVGVGVESQRRVVTDGMNPKFQFKAGSLSQSSLSSVPTLNFGVEPDLSMSSIHLTEVQLPLSSGLTKTKDDVDVNSDQGDDTEIQTNANANSDTETEIDTLLSPLQLWMKENGNVNSFTDNSRRRNNNIEKVGESFVIKNVSPLHLLLPNNITSKKRKRRMEKEPEDGESLLTQFSSKDNNKNETETNRLYGRVSFPIFSTAAAATEPEKNLKQELPIVLEIRKQNTENDNVVGHTPRKDHITTTNRISISTKNVEEEKRVESEQFRGGGDLYLTKEHAGGGEILPSCPHYLPLLVNQSVFVVKALKDGENFNTVFQTETEDTFLKDMDKWEKNLVKMSQCVATCLGSLSSSRMENNMSHEKKGTNGLGGGEGSSFSSVELVEQSGKSSFPVGISAPKNQANNYNGDITIPHHFLGDKVLTTCQKSCHHQTFLPQKSSNNPISITKKKQTEETNKVNDGVGPSTPQEVRKTTSTTSSIDITTGGDVSNQREMPEKIRKNDKNSSQLVVEVATNAKNKTTANTQFHLHWPKVISSALASSIKNTTPSSSPHPSIMLYNVMMLLPSPAEEKDESSYHLYQDKQHPQPSWKLIDQTVAQQTEISLPWTLSCGEKPKSHKETSDSAKVPQETLITQSLDGNENHHHFDPMYDPIPIKLMAIGSNGLEKVFSTILILVSTSKGKDDKSKSTLESTCCQSCERNWQIPYTNSTPTSSHNKNTEWISNPLRDLDHHPLWRVEKTTNSDHISSHPGSESENFVILRNKNSNIIPSNGINFKGSWASISNRVSSTTGTDANNSVRMSKKPSYKVESGPDLTRGKIDTTNINGHDDEKEEKDANRDDPYQNQQQFSSTFSTTTKAQEGRVKLNTTNKTTTTVNDWGLRTISMVYQNFLVVTEIAWRLPDEVVAAAALGTQSELESNEVEKNAAGSFTRDETSSRKNNKDSDTTGGESSNLVASSLLLGSKSLAKKMRKYQFLLTWEILGGGLKGNLVTDMTSGSISLWPDTAYFIQVGLIDPESEQSEQNPLEGTQEEQEKHQNYMSNLLGMESITFPLASFNGGAPKVTFTSPRLFLNTSMSMSSFSSTTLGISSQKKVSEKSSQSMSQRSGGQNTDRIVAAVIKPRQNDDRTRSKSNNPHTTTTTTTEEEKYPQFHHQVLHKNKVKLDKEEEEARTGNVRPITIPERTVIRNGNEFGNGHLPLLPFPSNYQAINEENGKNGQLMQVPSQSGGVTKRNPLSDTTTPAPGESLDNRNKKYYQKNYNGKSQSRHDQQEQEMENKYRINRVQNDGPGGKSVKLSSSPSLLDFLVQGGNDGEKLTGGGEDEKLHGKLYHSSHHSHSRHYLDTSGSSLHKMNSTPTNHYEDSRATINDHKNSSKNEKTSMKKKTSSSDHNHHEKDTKSAKTASSSSAAAAYRPEGYQGLFALNLGLGGYNYDHDEQQQQQQESSSDHSNNATKYGVSNDTGASVIYSVFVLIVVACVIFLFLVAFIGFFVVTSSITSTAQFFIPKRLRVWVIGGSSEDELLTGNDQEGSDNYYGYDQEGGGCGGGRNMDEEGRFIGDDLDDDLVGEWGDDVMGENGQQLTMSSSIRGHLVDMTHRDIGRT